MSVVYPGDCVDGENGLVWRYIRGMNGRQCIVNEADRCSYPVAVAVGDRGRVEFDGLALAASYYDIVLLRARV